MKRPIYAALDLHSRMSVLGSMDHEATRSRGYVSRLKQLFCEHKWSGCGEGGGRFI